MTDKKKNQYTEGLTFSGFFPPTTRLHPLSTWLQLFYSCLKKKDIYLDIEEIYIFQMHLGTEHLYLFKFTFEKISERSKNKTILKHSVNTWDDCYEKDYSKET